ncbi:MAG: hypothetical protein A2283_13815 [Lentisphaerae bacterium RIFOXYA12_FULL_48_11]|nr:MAG: hypothetical protein A2283_13815 [Lentisphaerae bacterium RIFOXYA12_FULL_48_11]
MKLLRNLEIQVAVVVCFLAFSHAVATEGGGKLDDVLLAQDLWTIDTVKFTERANNLGFRWVSTAKDSARSVMPGLTFRNMPVLEVIVRFSSNTVSSVMMSLYNRGDAGEIDEATLQKQIDLVTGEMSSLAGIKGREIVSRQATRVDLKVQSLVWEKAPSVYFLEYAFSRMKPGAGNRSTIRAEFINLSIGRQGAATQKQFAGEQKVDVAYSELKGHIKKTAEGDVYLDNVPMVDQGQKGYCALATTERIMRYYGVDVNQHELAQKAATATGERGGTDPESLVKVLKSMANALNVRTKTLQEFNIREFLGMIRDYNRLAKRKKSPEVILPTSGVIDIAKIYGELDKDTYLEMCAKETAQIDRFSKIIKDKVSNGFPVLWGVQLGLVDEKPELPQAKGGHLRLIIGYNSKSPSVIYSDSWGAGHEMKHMKLTDAYAITTGLYTIEPR